MQQGDLVAVGKIIAAHGIKGAVKVYPLTDFPEKRFVAGAKVMLNDGIELEIKGSQKHSSGCYLLFIKDVDTRNQAEKLKDNLLNIRSSELAELPKDTYWIDEIVGLKVNDQEGNDLGTLTEVMQGAANDIYTVKGGQGEAYIPAIKEAILEVDLSKKTVMVNKDFVVGK